MDLVYGACSDEKLHLKYPAAQISLEALSTKQTDNMTTVYGDICGLSSVKWALFLKRDVSFEKPLFNAMSITN